MNLTLRDKRCCNPACPGREVIYRPFEECSLALPGDSIGLDIILEIGAKRMREDLSFPRIFGHLRDDDIDISLMGVQNQFRKYLSLVGCHAGADSTLLRQLRQQGAVLPVIDGIQFGTGEATLYMMMDAISRRPLFGKEMVCRSAEDLIPFVAQVKELGIPIIGVVSDKEKGLVPAIEKALPGVRHQYCQLHYVQNVAKPMANDLKNLGAEVRKTEESLRKLERSLLHRKKKSEQTNTPLPRDVPVTLEFCQAARDEARRHARAPLDPPPFKRHQGLERVSQTVAEAQQKKGGLGKICGSSRAS